MTNVESNLKVARKALENGLLNGSATSFIEYIKDYDKKQLRNLTSKQYHFLNNIYKQFCNKF